MTSHARGGQAAETAIHSTFADDPEMRELIGLFITEMPGKVAELRRVVAAGDLAKLRKVAPILRGTSGGYGFPSLGSTAGRIEDLLTSQSNESSKAADALDRVKADVDRLIDLCSRVSQKAA